MISVEDLKKIRLFARRDGCSSKELLRQNLVANRCDFDEFDGVIVSDDLRFTIQAVLAGDGIAYVSRCLVSEHLASGKLIGLRVKGFEHRRGRSIVMLPQRKDDPLLKELLECIFEVVTPFWRPQKVNSG